jgi:hypothetical protein
MHNLIRLQKPNEAKSRSKNPQQKPAAKTKK